MTSIKELTDLIQSQTSSEQEGKAFLLSYLKDMFDKAKHKSGVYGFSDSSQHEIEDAIQGILYDEDEQGHSQGFDNCYNRFANQIFPLDTGK